MDQQQTLAMAAGFEKHMKQTRRAEFLQQMEIVVPWRELCAEIEPFYPKVGNGRPPVGLERMLWMYFLLQWFNLSDPAVEEALYDSVSMRHFVSIDLGQEPVPDETTVCKFRHLLERHGLGAEIFARVNGYLESRGVTIGTGTAPEAEDRTYRRWRSKLREWPEVREANRIKSKTRSRVEHVFASLKQRFGFVKVRYPGPR